MINEHLYIGIDIQTRRNCCYAVIDESGTLIESGWFSDDVIDALELIKRLSKSSQIYVGIDAPRKPLVSKRKWFWSGGKKQKWTPRKG